MGSSHATHLRSSGKLIRCHRERREGPLKQVGQTSEIVSFFASLRMTWILVALTMFTSQLLPLVMIGGFFFHIPMFINLGIVAYAVIVAFQLVTLPVEFNASARAKVILQQSGLIARDEMDGVNRVLNAAALTYVAALVAAVAHLLQLLLLSQRRR
jgi:Zn-dependent membrane protease YugP